MIQALIVVSVLIFLAACGGRVQYGYLANAKPPVHPDYAVGWAAKDCIYIGGVRPYRGNAIIVDVCITYAPYQFDQRRLESMYNSIAAWALCHDTPFVVMQNQTRSKVLRRCPRPTPFSCQELVDLDLQRTPGIVVSRGPKLWTAVLPVLLQVDPVPFEGAEIDIAIRDVRNLWGLRVDKSLRRVTVEQHEKM